MTLDHFRKHCLCLKSSTEELPFNENTLVFKVLGEIFALFNLMTFEFCNLKCDSEKAKILREKYSKKTSSWHINKKHWNFVNFIGDLNDNQIKQLVKYSYNLVVKNMPKKLREQL